MLVLEKAPSRIGQRPCMPETACVHVTMTNCVARNLVWHITCRWAGFSRSQQRPCWPIDCVAICPAASVTALDACLAWVPSLLAFKGPVLHQVPRLWWWPKHRAGAGKAGICAACSECACCSVQLVKHALDNQVSWVARAGPLSPSGWTLNAFSAQTGYKSGLPRI